MGLCFVPSAGVVSFHDLWANGVFEALLAYLLFSRQAGVLSGVEIYAHQAGACVRPERQEWAVVLDHDDEKYNCRDQRPDCQKDCHYALVVEKRNACLDHCVKHATNHAGSRPIFFQ